MLLHTTPRLAVAMAVIGTLVVTSAAAGAAGAALILGQVNSAGSSQTTLNSSSSNATLRVNNTGTGRGMEVEAADAAPLRLIAPDGSAPITVNSTTKVINLNADRLDGLNSTAFLRSGGIVTHHAGPWVEDEDSSISVFYSPAGTFIQGDAMGSQATILYVPSPGSIGNVVYGLAYVTVCVHPISSGVVLSSLEADSVTDSGFVQHIADPTDHPITADTCHTYFDASPEATWGTTIRIYFSFVNGGDDTFVRDTYLTWFPV